MEMPDKEHMLEFIAEIVASLSDRERLYKSIDDPQGFEGYVKGMADIVILLGHLREVSIIIPFWHHAFRLWKANRSLFRDVPHDEVKKIVLKLLAEEQYEKGGVGDVR